MKRFLLIALLGILNYVSFAQAGSLNVVNNTSCTVYYVIKAEKAPLCGFTYVSSLIALAPGANTHYPNAGSIPGLPPTQLFMNMANVYQRPPACGAVDPLYIGEPCTGLPNITTYAAYTSTCALCSPLIKAQWVPTPALGGLAQLRFF